MDIVSAAGGALLGKTVAVCARTFAMTLIGYELFQWWTLSARQVREGSRDVWGCGDFVRKW